MPASFYVHIPKSANKTINKTPLPWQVRILDALEELKRNPFLGEKMKGGYSGKRKIKVWPYRIIYIIREDIKLVQVMEIEHRGHVSYD